MTTITFTVDHGAGPVNYSNHVFEADIWRDTQNGIGRWQALLDPRGVFSPFGIFSVDEPVAISINGVLMMNGYIDDVRPYLDSRGNHVELYQLNGRDLGMDLAQFFYKPLVFDPTPTKGDYRNTLSGNIIRDIITNMQNAGIFGAGNPEINAPAAGIGGAINFEWTSRLNLADGFQAIAKLDNHDFYVDDATTNFIYFPIGTVASGVTLIDFPASPTNNILGLEMGEALGLDMKNYVEVFAGSLDDHYTDLNGTDLATTGWNSANATCTVGNNYAGAPAPGPFGPANFEILTDNGKTSIYCERSVAPAGNRLEMYLDFGALLPVGNGYNQGGSINLEDSSHIRYLVIQDDTDAGIPNLGNNVSVGLQDTTGRRIYYWNVVAGPAPNKQGYTGDLANNEWYEVTCHIGYDVRIAAAFPTADNWFFDVGAAFDWNLVRYIWFSTLQASPNPSWFVVDGLQIPTVDVSALAQNVVTPSPGYRMRAIDRRDLISQFELQDYADDYLAKYIDPLETVKLVTEGQTGTPFAGETVEVVATAFGIGGPLIGNTDTYRILALHHRVVKNSDASEYRGYNFLTEYDLVKNEVNGADQKLDPMRYYKSINPVEAQRRQVRLNQGYRWRKKIKTAYTR